MEEYKITKAEQEELRVVTNDRHALTIMVESQWRLAQDAAKAEKQWWDKVAKRLKLDRSLKYTADADTGIIKSRE